MSSFLFVIITILATAKADDCFPQGPCDDGYMDSTNGNYKVWECGTDCEGGSTYTNGVGIIIHSLIAIHFQYAAPDSLNINAVKRFAFVLAFPLQHAIPLPIQQVIVYCTYNISNISSMYITFHILTDCTYTIYLYSCTYTLSYIYAINANLQSNHYSHLNTNQYPNYIPNTKSNSLSHHQFTHTKSNTNSYHIPYNRTNLATNSKPHPISYIFANIFSYVSSNTKY